MQDISAPTNDLQAATLAVEGFFDMLRQPPLNQAYEHTVFVDQFLPAFAEICRYGSPAVVLDIESRLYVDYIKRWEEESHFRCVYQALTPLLRLNAEGAASDLHRIRKGGTQKTADPLCKAPTVFFVIHVESELAHIQSLLRYLEAYKMFEPEIDPIKPVVVSLDGKHPNLRQRLASMGVQLVSLSDANPYHPNGYVKLLKFAMLCRDHPPHAIVFVSVVNWITSFFSARLASTQIWWAMKYHAFSSPDIDGYLCGSPDGKPRLLGGNFWETAPFGGGDWFAPELTPAATKLHYEFGAGAIVFGSIGREEKLRHPPYLDAVCDILEANPGAVFLWTGRQCDPTIQSHFEQRRLADRTKFIGWVNTKLYAQVIDVYLDSFPFPGGYTVYEAMAAKKPVVMMRLDYANVGLQNNVSPYYFADDTGGINVDIQTLFRKREDKIYYPVADSAEEYVAFACRFARDAELSRDVGAINAVFVERFMSNRKGMAEGYTRAIRKFIKPQLTQ